ncbi:MAG: hypothetical protein HYX44_06635 [Aquabacterium sp.]|nr:hypothetical protein [Aquabacterium sp.]
MITIEEYAALAAHVYNNQRGGGGDNPETNLLSVPSGSALGIPLRTSLPTLEWQQPFRI